MEKKSIGMRKLLLTVFLCFSLPAMTLLIMLSYFTVQRQSDAEVKTYQRNLTAYAGNLERVIRNTDAQLSSIAYSNQSFQLFSCSETLFKKHLNAIEIINPLNMIQTQEDLIGGFFLFSSSPSYYYPIWKTTYSYENIRLISSFLSDTAAYPEKRSQWNLLALSDRLVYLKALGTNSNLIAAMIDPSLDSALQNVSKSNDNTFLFFATDSGEALYPLNFLESWENGWNDSPIQKGVFRNRPYRLIKYKIPDTEISMCYLIPQKSAWNLLKPAERIILILIVLLFFSVPFIWFALYRQLFRPLSALADNMRLIAKGQSPLQVPEDQPVDEFRTFSHTLNYMLQSIQRLQKESYEQKLDLQQAQLQYLYLQIRPHFYINCLKNIYSLAEQQQYKQIQEATLSLSDYFRYVFRDFNKMVSLSQELHFIKTYVTLQRINYARSVTLSMDIDARTSENEILPLSLLTFVENSMKHSQNTTNLSIHICSHLLETPKGMRLNLTVSDNNGGFSPEDLEILNHIPKYKSLYENYHVGISNIYYRMELTYHHEGMLFFYNQDNGSCVEITIPVKKENEET